MKNKLSKAIIGGAIMATCLGIGYATSIAFKYLDAIREDFNEFDYILNTDKEAGIESLNTTIAELEVQINELEQN